MATQAIQPIQTIQPTAKGYEFNLEEYWQILRRRRWVILFSAVTLAAFSWIFSWMNQPPPLYASSVLVKVAQSANLSEVLLEGPRLNPAEDMSTQLSLLQSYLVEERVAKRLGLIPKDMSSEEIRAKPAYMKVMQALKRGISAKQQGVSRIIAIRTLASSPEFARDMAQAVAEEFRIFNIEEKNRRVFNAKRFIQQQLVVLGGRLKKAEEAVRDFRERHHLFAMGQGSDVMSRVVSNMEQNYQREVSHLNDLQFALFQLKARARRKGWDYSALSVAGKVSPYFDKLNNRLIAMALKHTKLSTNFTNAHPAMAELRSQARDILTSMLSELKRQESLTRQRMADLQRNIEDSELKYRGPPEQALELRRLTREVGNNERLFSLLEKKYQEVLIKESGKIDQVSILRPALISNKRINPMRGAQTAVAGFILGLALGLIIALVLESMDASVGTIEEVESFLEIPVVGFIPHLDHDEASELFSGMEGLATSGDQMERQIRLITHFVPPSTISEAYRSLRTNLLLSHSGERRVILVTSATTREGKSSVAANLATVVAQQGARVLLIDADMRRPMQYKVFGLTREPGLSEYLLGQMSWRDVVKRISDVMLGEFGVDRVLMTPGMEQLDFITCGRKIDNASNLFAAPAMAELFEQARREYDMVIMDTPPLLHATDAAVMAGKVDGVLLVYRIGAVARGVLKRMKNSVEAVGGTFVGVVLNGVRGKLTSDYAKYKVDRYYEATRDEEDHGGGLDDGALASAQGAFRKLWQQVLDRVHQKA